jgi:sigma-B regulation protein RsbU (phosphoserine phosphatase)
MATQGVRGSSTTALQEENQRLRRAIEELSILNDLARAIGASAHTQQVMQTIIHRSLRAIDAEQGVITLVDVKASDPLKTLVRTAISSASGEAYHFSQSLLGWMHINKRPLTINDPVNDPRFRGAKWEPAIRSLLCVPMIVHTDLRGVLTVYNKKGAASFTEDDQRLLAIIAAQSAQVVENARLHESEEALQEMKEELRLAATIQADLLPQWSPRLEGYDIAGRTVPAQLVGGDYFDFIPIDGSRIALCLGDVSGKGLPASLLMANLQATLRGQTSADCSPRLCIMRSNRLLHQSTSPDKFVTLFYGILDSQRHTLCFCNAGHDYPFHIGRDREPSRLSTGGLVLSVSDEAPYEEETVSLLPGDLLVAYSDGITEAVNPEMQQFGEARLAQAIQEHRHEPAAVLIERIMGSVKEFAKTALQADDMTVLVLKRGG